MQQISNGDAAAAAAAAGPQIQVNHQYVKDLSFEIPGAPEIFLNLRSQPTVDLNLDVNARRIEGPLCEVEIAIRAEAKVEDKTAFIVELVYAGLFTLNSVPEAMFEPVLLVECPRLLFPFARNVVAEVTRDGGFPPVVLQPIDFLSLWQARRNAEAQVPVGTA